MPTLRHRIVLSLMLVDFPLRPDPAQSWDTPDPDLSPCFEQTALVWGPCLVLWTLAPFEAVVILSSKRRDVPCLDLTMSKSTKHFPVIVPRGLLTHRQQLGQIRNILWRDLFSLSSYHMNSRIRYELADTVTREHSALGVG
ncbi:Canalicular multispecific organic anion transporter 1 [Homalodisca vitripennis]|nr:Canalicular multispecific organic anion transporter 1 [Homalodisca vitripennis]